MRSVWGTSRARHALYEWLREAAGVDRAETMMGLLPPVGWGDVATRRDLEIMRSDLRAEFGELRGEFGELRGEFGELRGEIAERMRVQTITMVSVFVGVTGLFVGLPQLL